MFRSCFAALFLVVCTVVVAQSADSLQTLTYEFQTGAVIPESGNRVVLGTDIAVNAIVEDVSVAVWVEHPRLSDLTIQLENPAGKRVTLHNGGEGADLRTIYPVFTTPAESLSSVVGYPSGGTWSLLVGDYVPGATGTIVGWGLQIVVDMSKVILPTPMPEPQVGFERRQVLSDYSGVTDVAFPDSNRDGVPDLLVVRETENEVVIYRGLGEGWLGERTTFGLESPYRAVVGQFSSDTLPDLAIAAGSQIITLLGAENGNYTAGSQTGMSSQGEEYISAGHLNEDSIDDLLIGDPPRLFFGSSSGSFSGGKVVGGRGQKFFCSGDYDGDGFTDILVGLASQASAIDYYLMFGNASGTQSDQVRLTPPIQATLAGADDYNGDGFIDFWLWGPRFDNPSSVGLQIYSGNPDRNTSADYYPLSLASDRRSVLMSDLDEDGRSEIIVATGEGIYSYYQRIDGVLAERDSPLIDVQDTSFLRMADLDGDGHDDIVRVAKNEVDLWVRTLITPTPESPPMADPTATPTLFLFATPTPTPTPSPTPTPFPTATSFPAATPPPTLLPPAPDEPDLNGDGVVDKADLFLFMQAWHASL